MIIIQRLTPYWSSVLVVGLLYFGIINPEQWLGVGIGLFFIPVLAVIIMHQKHWRLEYFGFSVATIILLISSYTFILIQESQYLNYFILGVTAIFYFLFIKNIAIFLFQPAKYIPYSLEHISTYSNVVASFYLYVSIFIFYILGIGRLRYMLLAILIGTLVLTWQTFWIQKVEWIRAKFYVLAITLIMIEGTWVLHFWPVSYFVTGLLLTIAFYLLLHLSRHYLTDNLSKKMLARYLITSGIAVLVLLVTSRWI